MSNIKNLPYRYQAFGIHFASCIPCPQLKPSTATPNVEIKAGTVPDCLAQIRKQGRRYQATDDELLLKIPDVAAYWVKGGESIVIDRAPQSDDAAVQLYLWGFSIGALLDQRGLLVLHGSAVVVQGSAVLFLGKSGAGKSTLATAFHKLGYWLAADDICAIEVTPEHLMLHPSFPQVKLWDDACQKLDREQGFIHQKSIEPIYSRPGKYAVYFENSFWQHPLPLKRIYLLTPSDSQSLTLQPITGLQKIPLLQQQTHGFPLVQYMGYGERHLQQCIRVASQIPLVKVVRPLDTFLLEELVDLIEADVKV